MTQELTQRPLGGPSDVSMPKVVLEDLGWSKRYTRFVRAHYEAFEAAYLDQSSASRNELARLRREYETLPPRHICSCARMDRRTGITAYHCVECRRIGEAIPRQDVGAEIGRSGVHGSRVPLLVVLDLEAGYAA